MILVVGSLADQMVEFVCARLNQMKLKYFTIDPSTLKDQSITGKVGKIGVFEGSIQDKSTSKSISMNEISGTYARFACLGSNTVDASIISNEEKGMLLMENNVHLINILNIFPGTVINKPKDSQSNDSKLFQQSIIDSSIFKSPKTIITNRPEIVKEFYEKQEGKIIYKSISGIRSIVSKLDKSSLERLPLIRNCPTQFQELVQGLEIRVHVVGEKVFATGIASEAIDYRYCHRENKSSQFYPMQLPRDVTQECIKLARRLNLLVAGLDFKRTKEGVYYCFEANPSPAFVVYERMTGQPISEAVGLLLAGSHSLAEV